MAKITSANIPRIADEFRRLLDNGVSPERAAAQAVGTVLNDANQTDCAENESGDFGDDEISTASESS